jgi:hypothetical protein
MEAVGETHHAAAVTAVSQAVGVAQFVYRFLPHPLSEQGLVLWQAVEGWPQARQGDEGIAAVDVGLAEDKAEAWGVAIRVDHPQQALGI